MNNKTYRLTNSRYRDLCDRVLARYHINHQRMPHFHAKLDPEYAQEILEDTISLLLSINKERYHWLRNGLIQSDIKKISKYASALHTEKLKAYSWYREFFN